LPFEVFDYTHDNLKNCLTSALHLPNPIIIEEKGQLKCLFNIFEKLGTMTILEEKEYVNRDFLEDYSLHYVRSFTDYRRVCVRLHFFETSFTQKDFSELLKNPVSPESELSQKILQKSYHGFMVLKPLPFTIIGKTCLKTYKCENKRYFPAIRKYKANLFGIPLQIKSLAYQEQDRIAAACASSATWSVFHGTGMLFQHQLPSPVKITQWATKHFPTVDRHFPNKGLTSEQISSAIREVGLEPNYYDVKLKDSLKANIYAYLKGKIPMILGIRIFLKDSYIVEDDTEENTLKLESIESGTGHAVAVTGYCLGINCEKEYVAKLDSDSLKISLSSSRINKIFVHDDQIGPFSKIEIDKDTSTFEFEDGRSIERHTIQVSDPSSKEPTMLTATPELLIIPLYHKIRIPFERALDAVNMFNNLYNTFGKFARLELKEEFPLVEWDIFLSTVSDFKKYLLRSEISGLKKADYVTRQLPKYIWRAIAKVSNSELFEFILDATDIDQESFFVDVIVYDDSFVNMIAPFFSDEDYLKDELNITFKDMYMSLYVLYSKANSKH